MKYFIHGFVDHSKIRFERQDIYGPCFYWLCSSRILASVFFVSVVVCHVSQNADNSCVHVRFWFQIIFIILSFQAWINYSMAKITCGGF